MLWRVFVIIEWALPIHFHCEITQKMWVSQMLFSISFQKKFFQLILLFFLVGFISKCYIMCTRNTSDISHQPSAFVHQPSSILLLTSYFLHLTSYIIPHTSYISHPEPWTISDLSLLPSSFFPLPSSLSPLPSYISPSVRNRLRLRWVMPPESCLPTNGVIEITYLG